MKKIVLLLLCFVVGCGNQSETAKNDSKPIKTTTQTTTVNSTKQSTDNVEVDLTAMSSTMVYAEVYNMLIEPEKYIDKKIKVKGFYALFVDESTKTNFHAVLIEDALGCCSQGLEFELDTNNDVNTYPAEGQQIEITGVLKIKKAKDYNYIYIETKELKQI